MGLEFPKIRGTLFWDPYSKDATISISGTLLGSPIFGNSHLRFRGLGLTNLSSLGFSLRFTTLISGRGFRSQGLWWVSLFFSVAGLRAW